MSIRRREVSGVRVGVVAGDAAGDVVEVTHPILFKNPDTTMMGSWWGAVGSLRWAGKADMRVQARIFPFVARCANISSGTPQ